MADDLDDEDARDRLEDALARLTADSEGLAAVSDGLARLRAQPGPRLAELRGRAARRGDRGG